MVFPVRRLVASGASSTPTFVESAIQLLSAMVFPTCTSLSIRQKAVDLAFLLFEGLPLSLRLPFAAVLLLFVSFFLFDPGFLVLLPPVLVFTTFETLASFRVREPRAPPKWGRNLSLSSLLFFKGPLVRSFLVFSGLV